MKIIILIITILIIPLNTHAFSLNPLNWCRSNIQTIEKPVDRIVEKIIEKPVEKIVDNPDLQKKIDSLTKENKSLKSQIISLKSKLSSFESSTDKTTTLVSDNSTKIKTINIKLAELDQLSFRIVNYKDKELLDAINEFKTIDGDKLFDPNKMNLSIIGANNTISILPDRNLLYKMTEEYKQKLKIELTKL